MFTGIIKEIGVISKTRDMGQDREFTVRAETIAGSVHKGGSISVNGVCLTIKHFNREGLSFDVSSNTLQHSNLGSLEQGDPVNLEDSLPADGRIGGHFVSGHVDAVSSITGIIEKGRSYEITFTMEEGIAPFIAPRGSVAIDGISLTVTETAGDSFRTVIIPHTYKNTTLGVKATGARVNVEVDMLARYIVNYLSRRENDMGGQLVKDRILREKLEENGFIQ